MALNKAINTPAINANHLDNNLSASFRFIAGQELEILFSQANNSLVIFFTIRILIVSANIEVLPIASTETYSEGSSLSWPNPDWFILV